MKKLILSIVCILGIASLSIAQGGDERPNREESRKKLEASKIAYMTSYLDLSSEEAAKFWPVYNEYQKAKKDLKGPRKPKGEAKKTADLTDAEAADRLNQYMSMESKKADLKVMYLEKFRAVLSDKKVLMLTRAEGEFKKQVVKRYADRRRGGGKGGPREGQRK